MRAIIVGVCVACTYRRSVVPLVHLPKLETAFWCRSDQIRACCAFITQQTLVASVRTARTSRRRRSCHAVMEADCTCNTVCEMTYTRILLRAGLGLLLVFLYSFLYDLSYFTLILRKDSDICSRLYGRTGRLSI
jgi:hypothetical protein